MAIIIIINKLKNEILKKFKGESKIIFKYIKTLEDNPYKGKVIGNAGSIIIKELRYKKFRFYFIVVGDKLKVFSQEELKELLLKFVRMSDKKNQQKIINEIKDILKNIGTDGF